MAQLPKLLPWLHLPKKNGQREDPIYLRITYNNKRAELSTGKFIKPSLWHKDKKRVKLSADKSADINDHIDALIRQINESYRELNRKGAAISADTLKSSILKPTAQMSLLATIDSHNFKMLKEVGLTYAKNTYKNYYFFEQKIKAFLKNHYKRNDLLLEELSYQFLHDFEHYLITHDGVIQHTANKYLTKLKKINMALDLGWMTKSPIRRHKSKRVVVQREVLTEAELKRIENLVLGDYAALARDLFLVQCYTGLNYIDLRRVSGEGVITGADGKPWIVLYRKKTNTFCYSAAFQG